MNSTNVRLLVAFSIAVLLTPLVALHAEDTTKPNIIYIMADELGYYEPSFMGNPNIQTPNLDRMAAEGIRFNNLFAGSSVCAPTRCCLLDCRSGAEHHRDLFR